MRSALGRPSTLASLSIFVAGLVPLTLVSCGGGQAGDPNNRGAFRLALATTGVGQIYPYRIAVADDQGDPTNEILDILEIKDFRDNSTAKNSVLPVATWPTSAQLPGGNPGNQYLLLRFTHDLDATSILSDLPANQGNSGLVGSIQVLEYDPLTETQRYVTGRAFVGGYTYYDDPATPNLDLKLTKAVEADKDGNVTVVDSRANGFPLGFTHDEDLVAANSFVFVPDATAGLTSFETFPAGKVVRVIATNAVRDYRKKSLVEEICTATVVGPDTIAPEILGYSSGNLSISPGNGAIGVDPTTYIELNFSKPVQPRDVGQLFDTTDLTPDLRGVGIDVQIASSTVKVNYYADPRTAGDFCNYIVRPSYSFQGNQSVTVTVNPTITGLANVKVGTRVQTSFTTGEGPGLVRAPVAPEAIYVGRGGSSPGISVLDLNGFGQGTGDFAKYSDSNYNLGFKRNPNLGQPGVFPPLGPGSTNLDAGSLGALTLTVDSRLSTLLVDERTVSRVADVQLGHPLDKVFNNENINVHAGRQSQTNPLTGSTQKAWGNNITAPPIPNPPKFAFPPPNPSRGIWGIEPTTSTGSTGTAVPPCVTTSAQNKLVIGNPFSQNQGAIGVFWTSFPGFFYGPNPSPGSPQPPVGYCPYYSRQQIGHFTYALDREKKQVLVLNSNRMTVLDTLRLPDPYAMAVSPNLKRLAVSNYASGTVSLIDIDPASPTFHTVVTTTPVDRGPSAMAWQPEGEDLLVACTLGNSVAILRGSDGGLRKTVGGLLNRPIDVVVTSRQVATGWSTGIYFAYVLNSNGTIAIFESGPNGVNGIGFDDMVGVPQSTFPRATTMQPDIASFNSAVYIAHKDDKGLGQISHLELTSSTVGALPISPNSGGFILPPTFRQREWTVTGRLGGDSPTTTIRDRLSGDAPVDFALDEMQNVGTWPEIVSNQNSNLIYADHSGKGHIRINPANGQPVIAVTSRYIFVALQDTGFLDVLELDSGRVISRIPVPGIATVSSYWKM
ncbi:MAG: Ig-like domain-containing protein [Planctomycetes bacterium]|nr:Ig-like domain-containing protein [Planctomycetota bacterium]